MGAQAVCVRQSIFLLTMLVPTEEGVRDVPREGQRTRGRAPNAAAPTGDSQKVDTEEHPPLFGDLSLVEIHGIEKKPGLNGQIGVVFSYDGGEDRRYTVRVLGNQVRLREDKLKVAPPGWEGSDDYDAIPELSPEERLARAEEKAAAKRA